MTKITNQNRVVMALAEATRLHDGQTRDDGTPYIGHPVEVMMILTQHGVTDGHVLATALMHDTHEDCDQVEAEAATRRLDVHIYVDYLTKLKTEELAECLEIPEEHITKQHKFDEVLRQLDEGGPIVQAVKMADRLSNLRSARRQWGPERLARYAYEGYILSTKFVAALPTLSVDLNREAIVILNEVYQIKAHPYHGSLPGVPT